MVYSYNPEGKVEKKTTYSNEGTIVRRVLNEYDEQGEKIKKTVYDPKNTKKEYTIYHY
jgi:hypothetical protein